MKYRPKTKPFSHQRQGLIWLWRKTRPASGIGTKGGGLFWDPGTGKSKGILDFIGALLATRTSSTTSPLKVLIVCPINAMQVWPDQIEKHLEAEWIVDIPHGRIIDKAHYISELEDEGEVYFLILNFAAIIKRDQRWKIMDAILNWKPDVLIVDECHHIKGATTKQSKAVHKIAAAVETVVIATGTPIGSNWLDLYSQLKAIDPNIWKSPYTKTGVMSWTNFRNRYAILGGPSGHQILGWQNLDDLQSRYLPHVRSVRKADVHDMPKVTDQVIPVELSSSARNAYEAFAADGLVVYKQHLIDAPIVLTKLLRLQQMTGGWVHDEHGDSVEFQTDKLTVFTGLLEDLLAAERSVIVFARFIAELDAILRVAGPSASWVGAIRGGVGSDDRTRAVRLFGQHKGAVLVVQVASAEALDGLQHSSSDAIFYSSDYSLIHWNQARGRLDRAGQKEPVNFYHMHVQDSVDQLIFTALRDKKNLEKLVMDHPDVLLTGLSR